MSQDDILDVLKDGKKRTLGEIAEALGTEPKNVKQCMARLDKWKLVEREIIVPPGRFMFRYFMRRGE